MAGEPPPDEFALITEARYLGVPPWELAAQPVYWRRLAAWHAGIVAAAQDARRDK